MSDWAIILTMRIFYRACRNAARKNCNFKLLTHHYIARNTLVSLSLIYNCPSHVPFSIVDVLFAALDPKHFQFSSPLKLNIDDLLDPFRHIPISPSPGGRTIRTALSKLRRFDKQTNSCKYLSP